MKKLTTIIALIFLTGIMFSQETGPTWEGLIKQKEKSDAEITNSKKAASSKTWIKRANTYFDIYSFVTGGLYKGMPAKGNGIQNVEYLIGKPGKIMKQGDEEIWVYNRKKLYFKNGLLDRWEQTEFIDKDALKKSAEALLKAVELDEKGKLKEKSSTKDLNEMIKNSIINEAITNYQQKKYDDAYNLMDYGYKLTLLPKQADDTVYTSDKIIYFKGIIASDAKKYDEAIENFEQCIKNNYKQDAAYHYLAVTYKDMGNDEKFIETINKAREKYPENEQLLIDLINYYMMNGEQEKAEKFLDIAIENNPENPSYYTAKATIYDNKTDTLSKLYDKYMEEAYNYKKEAFRNRNNAKLKAQSEAKRDEAVKKAMENYNLVEENISKAEKLYQKSLDINPKFYTAAYNIGRLYSKLYDLKKKHSDWLLKVYINKNFAESTKFENAAKDDLKIAAQKFENATKIKPDDLDGLQVLKRIYFKLHDQENLKRIEGKINNLSTSKDNSIE